VHTVPGRDAKATGARAGRRRRLRGVALAIFSAACLGAYTHGTQARAECPDTAGRGAFNVATLNLLFYEVAQRDARLAIVADALAARAQAGDPVDVVLLQEVVGGSLSRTENAARDLERAARDRGLDYELEYSTYFSIGGPPLLAVSNAILSRCRVVASADFPLPTVVEDILPGVRLPIRRTVSLALLDVPGAGLVSVYNTHLCAYCGAGDRMRQAQAMMDGIEFAQSYLPATAVVLGGDMNTRVDVPAQRPLYQLITAGHGFRDAYAEANACTDCCSAQEGYAGCTFAVPGNPFAVDIVTREPEAPQRLDYIFVRPDTLAVQQALVVPEAGVWVSDHSGVLVRLGLSR